MPNVTQTLWMSLAESVVNVVVGYGLAVLTQVLLFPLFGYAFSLHQNLLLGLAFTAVSLARSFVLRRVFEAIRVRQGALRFIDDRAG